MTQKWKYYLMTILLALLCWFFGYIKFPFVDTDLNFVLGFLLCTVLVLLTSIIKIIINYSSQKITKLSISNNIKHNKSKLKLTNITIIISSLLLLNIIVFFLYFKTQKETSNKLPLFNYKEQLVLQENQKLNLEVILSILSTIDSIPLNNINQKSHLINKIVSLSSLLKEHNITNSGSTLTKPLSDLKATLLICLIRCKIDSTSFAIIKKNISFEGTNLSNANLNNADLSGINLSNSNLQNANLQYSNLNFTNLRHSNLENANLNYSKLIGSNLQKSNLKWAKINYSNLESAQLDSSDLSNCTCTNSRFSSATFITSNLSNSILNKSIFNESYLLHTDLSFAILNNSILSNANITNSNFYKTSLNNSIVQKNFYEKLNLNSNIHINFLLNNYFIYTDTILTKDSITFQLMER